MGQKANPVAMRLKINRTWGSRWFATDKSFKDLLHEDLTIRKYITNNYGRPASVSSVVIERVGGKIIINIHTAKPGILIGRKGADIDKIKKAVEKLTKSEVHLNIIEI